MHSCNLIRFQLLQLLLHVSVDFVLGSVSEFEPNLQNSWQTLPNVLVAKLNAFHVVKDFLDLLLSAVIL